MTQPIAVSRTPEQRDVWQKVFGRHWMYLADDVARFAEFPDHGPTLFYLLDLDRITDNQMTAAVEHLANKFDLDLDQVRADIQQLGLPVLVENVDVWFASPIEDITRYNSPCRCGFAGRLPAGSDCPACQKETN
ncbi:MAG: hypothetical protein R6X32_05930 [Chloroflexota bacterium]